MTIFIYSDNEQETMKLEKEIVASTEQGTLLEVNNPYHHEAFIYASANKDDTADMFKLRASIVLLCQSDIAILPESSFRETLVKIAESIRIKIVVDLSDIINKNSVGIESTQKEESKTYCCGCEHSAVGSLEFPGSCCPYISHKCIFYKSSEDAYNGEHGFKIDPWDASKIYADGDKILWNGEAREAGFIKE